MSALTPVIGLEVHAQLRTRSKLFCGCAVEFGAPPNSRTCPVCAGHPGALPVLNEEAVALAVRAACALGCEIRSRSVFARKNYVYPDLPKGYQITQYAEPLAEGGDLRIETPAGHRRIRLTRLHLEEDAGKLVHAAGSGGAAPASLVDLNRAGVPLVEIVSEPELRSPEEAYLFLQRLRSILRYAGVCEGSLEEGSMRCDANVSLRRASGDPPGTRTELKNVNSFRNVERGLAHEIRRQRAVVESGGAIEQATLVWDAEAGETRLLRGKEEEHDYRYFPEPDLPVLVLDPVLIEMQRRLVPELPVERLDRLVATYGLAAGQAHRLTLERGLADWFEAVAVESRNATAAANLALNDLARAQNEAGRDEGDIPLPPSTAAELIQLVDAGTISGSVGRGLFEEVYRTGRRASELVAERGITQTSDREELRKLAERAIGEHPEEAETYRKGKRGVLGFFVGEVVRASRGRANPKLVRELLEELLG